MNIDISITSKSTGCKSTIIHFEIRSHVQGDIHFNLRKFDYEVDEGIRIETAVAEVLPRMLTMSTEEINAMFPPVHNPLTGFS